MLNKNSIVITEKRHSSQLHTELEETELAFFDLSSKKIVIYFQKKGKSMSSVHSNSAILTPHFEKCDRDAFSSTTKYQSQRSFF